MRLEYNPILSRQPISRLISYVTKYYMCLMGIVMNYKRIYDNLMNLAQNRSVPNDYTEEHHIVPESWGGSDERENIAVLTGREHLFAHMLLAKAFPTSNMVHAAFKMACTKDSLGKEIKLSSKLYHMVRKLHAERISLLLKGYKHKLCTCPHCGKEGGISIMERWHFDNCLKRENPIPRKKTTRIPHPPEHKAKIAKRFAERKEAGWINPLVGTKLNSPAQVAGLQKMVQTRIERGSYNSPEERLEILNKLKLEQIERKQKNSNQICPHCNKKGAGSTMKMWHFDNCKEK